MLARRIEQKKPVWVSLASLKTELTPLSAKLHKIIEERPVALAPFYEAAVELSEEQRVSGSKVIPVLKMLHLPLQPPVMNVSTLTETQLTKNLRRVADMQSTSALCLHLMHSSFHLFLFVVHS